MKPLKLFVFTHLQELPQHLTVPGRSVPNTSVIWRFMMSRKDSFMCISHEVY